MNKLRTWQPWGSSRDYRVPLLGMERIGHPNRRATIPSSAAPPGSRRPLLGVVGSLVPMASPFNSKQWHTAKRRGTIPSSAEARTESPIVSSPDRGTSNRRVGRSLDEHCLELWEAWFRWQARSTPSSGTRSKDEPPSLVGRRYAQRFDRISFSFCGAVWEVCERARPLGRSSSRIRRQVPSFSHWR